MMGDFPDCDVKVCDFEISRVILDGTQIRELLGTPEYVAPEILHYEPITLSADMWSLGVTVYVLLTGFSPFGGETDQETFLNISQARLDFPEELFEDVSENAVDFIKKLLVRNPSGRMTAKECLRHPWLASNKRKPKSNKKVSSPTTSTSDINRSRVGCSSCTAPTTAQQQNLRRYLSKSREALFERVVSKHKQHSMDSQATGTQNLRKSTLISQYDKTRRMCESQMSLVSKSRERLLQDSMMSPSITRSREKLYGLKSLSKSHEVLNLCKTVSALASSSDSKRPLEGLLKTLTRAATATEILVPSEEVSDQENNNDPEKPVQTLKVDEETLKDLKPCHEEGITESKPAQLKEPVIASLPTLPEYQPLQTVLTLIRNNRNYRDKSEKIDDDKENILKSEDTTNTDDQTRVTERPKLCITKQLSVISSEGDDLHSPAISHTDSLSLTEGNSSINSSDSDISEEDNGSLERVSQGEISDAYDEDETEEPRFTVKQLISAYNMHQEIVTKTSLEVTMNVSSPDQKILPVIEKIPNKKFPTGPNALRLFIPDLHISRAKRLSRRRQSVTTNSETKDEIQDLGTNDPPTSNNEETSQETQTKKLSLTLDEPKHDSLYNRSSSLSSETSYDKTSGVSSTLTSNEELNPAILDTACQRKYSNTTNRSNRSSGVLSNDSDIPDVCSTKNSINNTISLSVLTGNRHTSMLSTQIGVSQTTNNKPIELTLNDSPIDTINSTTLTTNTSTSTNVLSRQSSTQSIATLNVPPCITQKPSTEPTTKSPNPTRRNDRLNVNTVYTPRMNRKSFPSTRTPNANHQTTDKTRRKSNPITKPPFY